MDIGIILAAGVGSRFNSSKPKQYYLIEGKPVIYYTMRSFISSGLFDAVVVVLSSPYRQLVQGLIDNEFGKSIPVLLCEGGETRQHSLLNGINHVKDNLNIEKFRVVSHCAARPLLSRRVLQQNLEMIEPEASVDTVRRVYDTMLYQPDGGEPGFIDRNRLYTGLTPQSFWSDDYIDAFLRVEERVSGFTCACSLMQGAGYRLKLLITEEPIHKITVREDISIIRQQMKGWNL